MLTDTVRFRCPENVAARVLDGEAVMIHLESGRYYSAEGLGAVVWHILDGGARFSDVVDAVTERFALPPQEARDDVGRFVAALLEEHLLVTAPDEAAMAAARPIVEYDGAYAAPTLHAYRDMADLLALDPPMPSLKPMG